MIDPVGTLDIAMAPPAEREAALRLLFGHVADRRAREGLIASLLASAAHEADPFSGLLVARRQGQLVGAVWAQEQPGATAAVWFPGLARNESNQLASVLLSAADGYLQARPVRLAQALLESDTQPAAEQLRAAGFVFFAKLIYMAAADDQFPTAAPRGKLQFEPYAEAEAARLARLIDHTYLATLDCPKLNGVRSADDVLAGYRATGVFEPARWQFARLDGHDAGCLLLADHPGANQCELVYMGLAPEARGQGLGMELVRQAQWITRLARRPRLVLAVDAANRYALEIYRRAGFFAWNERSVFIRVY